MGVSSLTRAALVFAACAGVQAAPRGSAFAQTVPGGAGGSVDPLVAAEAAFARVDFDNVRTAARAALEAGGHSSVEVARIWYLIALSSAALRDAVAARDAFVHVVALVPHQDLLASLSPPMRPPYQEARAWWAAQRTGFGASVARDDQGIRVHVNDPAHMARAVSARVRSGGGSFVPVRVPVAATVELPIAGITSAAPVQYAVRVVDEWGNRLVELGTETSPRTLNGVADTQPIASSGTESSLARWRWWAVGGMVAGGATIALGGYADSLRQGHASTWNSATCLANGQSRQQNCGSEYNAAVAAQSWAIAGFAVGGALLVAGGVLLLIPALHGDGERTTTEHASLGCGPAWLGIACTGHF